MVAVTTSSSTTTNNHQFFLHCPHSLVLPFLPPLLPPPSSPPLPPQQPSPHHLYLRCYHQHLICHSTTLSFTSLATTIIFLTIPCPVTKRNY
ncbi:hypothetical protein RDI58_011677 [Solanum bulbocastanum]|uniref:Uncharacterized protein n=1 Tax=Solanum bulbocastanum TaxID=147425 RepID=A0AAN8YHW6_SOLBU